MKKDNFFIQNVLNKEQKKRPQLNKHSCDKVLFLDMKKASKNIAFFEPVMIEKQ